MNQYATPMLNALRPACPPKGLAWLEPAMARIAAGNDVANDLAMLSAMARRKIGVAALDGNSTRLDTPAGPVDLRHWNSAEVARALLILAAMDASQDSATAIDFLFRHGDETERACVVRGLALFDPETHLKHLILEAGRANSLQLVSAVSLHNPYPRAHYNEQEFNQLVLKNLFVGLPIADILGLAERANPELARMCEDYYDERTAAGRGVPEDIWLAMAQHASTRGEQLMLAHLGHDAPGHRCYAAIAIGQRLQQHPELGKSLEQRLQTETDAGVIRALETALAT